MTEICKNQNFSLSREFLEKERFRVFLKIEGISKIIGYFKNGDITLLMAFFTYDCTLNEK